MQPERVGERGPVEGRGHAGPPVDHHRHAGAVLHVAAADVPALLGLVVDPAEAQRAGIVVEGVEPPLELPLHGLGVGLVGGQDVFVGDPGGGAAAHLLEAVLREPQARALERNVRVGHFADNNRRKPPAIGIFEAHTPASVSHLRGTRRPPPLPSSCAPTAHFVR